MFVLALWDWCLTLDMWQEMVKSRCEENGEFAMESSHQKSVIKTTSVGLLYSIEDTPPWYLPKREFQENIKSHYLTQLTQLVSGFPSPHVFVISAIFVWRFVSCLLCPQHFFVMSHHVIGPCNCTIYSTIT